MRELKVEVIFQYVNIGWNIIIVIVVFQYSENKDSCTENYFILFGNFSKLQGKIKMYLVYSIVKLS